MAEVKKCMWCYSEKLDEATKRKDGSGILKCQSCGLTMLSSVPENLDSLYGEESYFNPVKKVDTGYDQNYDLMTPLSLLWQVSIVDQLTISKEKKTFFEVGCATGNLLELTQEFIPNLTAYGIDVSKYSVAVCKEKGLEVSLAGIEEYTPKRKFDIIFSSETMEHLTDLKVFMEKVKKSMSNAGTFVFFVPCLRSNKKINREEDVFSHPEHLIFFTSEFFKKELSKFFGVPTNIYQINTDFGSSIVGIVSFDEKSISKLKVVMESILKNELPSSVDNQTLTNLAIIASKFSKFELAERSLASFKDKDSKVIFAEGVIACHKGEIHKAKEKFLESFGGGLIDYVKLKILYNLNSELINIYEKRLLRQEAGSKRVDGSTKGVFAKLRGN